MDRNRQDDLADIDMLDVDFEIPVPRMFPSNLRHRALVIRLLPRRSKTSQTQVQSMGQLKGDFWHSKMMNGPYEAVLLLFDQQDQTRCESYRTGTPIRPC